MNKLVVFSQPSCHPCKAAIAKLEREGIQHTVVNIREDEAALQRLSDAGIVGTPAFAWGGSIHTLADLPQISREALAQQEVPA